MLVISRSYWWYMVFMMASDDRLDLSWQASFKDSWGLHWCSNILQLGTLPLPWLYWRITKSLYTRNPRHHKMRLVLKRKLPKTRWATTTKLLESPLFWRFEFKLAFICKKAFLAELREWRQFALQLLSILAIRGNCETTTTTDPDLHRWLIHHVIEILEDR